MRYGPKKDRSPLTRMLRQEKRLANIQEKLAGDGKRYKYKNNSTGDLGLPKPAEDGRTAVAHNGTFIGDGYFLCMVPQCLTILEDLNVQENKLITEQPPIVTNEGTVELVQQKQKQQKLNENKPSKQKDVLLTEDPIGGIAIME